MPKKIAVYAGSFDPITLGHLDVAEKVRSLFDEIHIVVADNRQKKTLFTANERVKFIQDSLEHRGMTKTFHVASTEGLVVDYCRLNHASHLIRGLRAVSDFESEFSLAVMNRRLESGVTTVHVMADEKYFFLSSSLVKEVAGFGRSVDDFVTPTVAAALKTRFNQLRNSP